MEEISLFFDHIPNAIPRGSGGGLSKVGATFEVEGSDGILGMEAEEGLKERGGLVEASVTVGVEGFFVEGEEFLEVGGLGDGGGVKDLKDGDGLLFSFDADQVDGAGEIRFFEMLISIFTDEKLAAIEFIGGFESSGEVDAIADDGVIHAFEGADIAGDDFAGVDADADFEGFESFACAVFVEFGEAAEHLNACGDGLVGVFVATKEAAEDGHKGIADVFVEDALVAEDDIDHLSEVFVE